MQVVYVLNEEPFYMTMASFSVESLRQYNPKLPVTIYFIEDDCRDSRDIQHAISFIENNNVIELIDKKTFFALCESLNVELIIYKNLDLMEEKGYPFAQRIVLRDCHFPSVLFLDVDTFIFDDISCLFDIYKNLDLVATPNIYGEHHLTNWNNKSIQSFNSGVVMFNNHFTQKYGEEVYDYCLKLKNKTHPMGEWLWQVSSEAFGREELALTLFVLDHDLKYDYFKPEHVQTEKYIGKTKIYHSLTQNWLNFKCSNTY